ncbi:MAG: DUF4342 domain-containing protein [Anaerolineae bacterium]|nr:DUF4342 domain-containing protein [Anaerolineae bacterium]
MSDQYDNENQDVPVTEAPRKKTFTEEIEVAGNQAVERVKQLVEEGNVRRLIIRNMEDDIVLEMPLTVGALAGGAIALAAPWLAALGAFAALVARVKIEIVREVTVEEEKTE